MPPAKRPAPVTDFLAGWSSAHYTACPAAPASERMQPLELLISREALGVTRKILADALEVSVSSIRAWESGHPTISKGVRRDVEHLEAYTEALTAQLTVRRTTGTSTIGIYTRDGELSELDLPDAPLDPDRPLVARNRPPCCTGRARHPRQGRHHAQPTGARR